MSKSKLPWIIVLVVVIVAAIIFVGWMLYRNLASPAPAGTPVGGVTAPTSSQISLFKVAASTTPLGIPADLPIAANAEIVSNGDIGSSIGSSFNPLATQESVRSYLTKQTPAQAYTAYDTYFKGPNWNIVSTLDQTGVKSIDAKNKYVEDELVVTINQVSSSVLSANSMVSITAIFTPIIVSGTLMMGPQPNL